MRFMTHVTYYNFNKHRLVAREFNYGYQEKIKYNISRYNKKNK